MARWCTGAARLAQPWLAAEHLSEHSVQLLRCVPMGSIRLAAVLLLATLAPAQRVWIVNKAGGAGVDFTDIPPAITAASPGDIVRVLGNASVTYSPFTLSKALTVEARSGAMCYGFFITNAVTISNLPPGAVARISGLRVVPFMPVQATSRGAAVSIVRCGGNVILSGLTYRHALLSALDSATVLVSDCAPTPTGHAPNWPEGPTATIVRSGVVFQRSRVIGAYGQPGLELFPRTNGGPAIRVQDATVVCADTVVEGGPGAGPGNNGCGSNGGNGIEMQGGSCVLMGLSSLTAGAAGTSTSTSCDARSWRRSRWTSPHRS